VVKKKCISSFRNAQQGIAAIEMAFILPLLMLFLFGVIEYGAYFLKSQMNSNNVAAAAAAVIADPGDLSHEALLTQSGLLNDAGVRACAASFLTIGAATAGPCPGGWDTFEPEGMPEDQTAYFVLIESEVESRSLSGLFDAGGPLGVIMPDNIVRQVVRVSTVDSSVPCIGLVSRGTHVIAAPDTECFVALTDTNDDSGKNWTSSACRYTKTTGTLRVSERNARKTKCSYICFEPAGSCTAP
jgi:hypothetical protein